MRAEHRHFRRALVVSISSNILISSSTNNNLSPPRHSYININPIGPPTILSGLWTRRSTGGVVSNVIIDIKSDTDRCG